MNRRLQAIEQMIHPGIGMIDVGTDHGYLPVSLAQHGYPGALFASDIGEGPLSAGLCRCLGLFCLLCGIGAGRIVRGNFVDCAHVDTLLGVLERARFLQAL